MTEHQDGCGHPPLRYRNIAFLVTGDGSEISVDHLYVAGPETCSHDGCDNPAVSPGMVGLALDDAEGVFTPAEALLIANRLTRAANIVLEAEEQLPDIEREAARHTIGTGTGD